LEVGATIDEALQLVAHAARSARTTLRFERPDKAVELDGVPSRLSQAVVNLVTNAIDATGDQGGGKVTLGLERLPSAVAITVSDDGPGIDEALQARIFEPLFTTKPHGKGTGLGLSIVEEAVRDDFGGTVTLVSSPGAGATFRILVPTQEKD
jgi:signal transduction histidine kinase